jgi:hypothetical protein
MIIDSYYSKLVSVLITYAGIFRAGFVAPAFGLVLLYFFFCVYGSRVHLLCIVILILFISSAVNFPALPAATETKNSKQALFFSLCKKSNFPFCTDSNSLHECLLIDQVPKNVVQQFWFWLIYS